MKKLLAFITLFVFCAMAYASAEKLDRRMVVINHSDQAIIGLAASPIDAPKWNYNMLNGDAIPIGGRKWADFDDRTGYCRYDLLATGANGGRWEKYNVNVCASESWTLNP